MAPYIFAEEKDLVALPDELTYTDGAQVACGFGTAYEGLEKIGISGNDAVLVVGLGPVGLTALMLAKAMGANKLIGVDVVDERLEVAQKLGLADHVLKAGADNVEAIRSWGSLHIPAERVNSDHTALAASVPIRISVDSRRISSKLTALWLFTELVAPFRVPLARHLQGR
jgi:D-arabinose 1-dehydrogenase-like Zn-dependent alcohol dehydrogenase